MEDAQPTPIVSVGDVDISQAVVEIKTNSAMSKEGTARIAVDTTHASFAGIDYANEIVVAAKLKGVVHRIFTGDISDVFVVEDDGRAIIECGNMTVFRELAIGHLQVSNCGAADIVYALAKSAGLDDAKIDIQGVSDPDPEEFEVVAPVNGIQLDAEIRVGQVLFVPASLGIPANCREFDLTGDAQDFAQADAFAVVEPRQVKMYGAQKVGLDAIDDAISWIISRSRYSLAVGPSGQLANWSRGQMRFSPARGRLVCVHGKSTGRAWLRSAVDVPVLSPLGILEDAPADPLADPNLTLALASCRRAATAERFTERIAAIWESIEYFVGSQKAPRLFTQKSLDDIRQAVQDVDLAECGSESSRRLNDLIGQLNDAPLMARFSFKLKDMEIAVRDEDMRVLSKLRKVRNKASHGKEAKDPGRHAIDRGVAVLARILVTAAYRT